VAAALTGLALLAPGFFRTDSAPVAQVVPGSEFIPLDHGAITELDGTVVVRLELSGAMLAGLGWPGYLGSSPDPVEAELLLGQDGVARAIRFLE
jgi:hypothetical protein